MPPNMVWRQVAERITDDLNLSETYPHHRFDQQIVMMTATRAASKLARRGPPIELDGTPMTTKYS